MEVLAPSRRVLPPPSGGRIPRRDGAKKAVPGLTGQCLHAVGLQFIHPWTKDLVSLTCPLPEEFTAMLRKIDR